MEKTQAKQLLKRAAEQAIACQDGCNSSGIAISFAEIIREMCSIGGTRWRNEHPITTLFLSKLVELNHSSCYCTDCMNHFGAAYDICKRIADGEDDPTLAAFWDEARRDREVPANA
jgi:hypothetical protein